MADYEWSWPTRIDRDAIEAALRLEFLDGGRNVVLVAPQCLGKTMIARNIANQAVLAGHSVLFVTAAQLLLDLAAQDSARASSVASATIVARRCSASMKLATCPTTPATRTSCSRSSAAATSTRASS